MKKFCQSLKKHEMKIITDKLNRQSYYEMNSRTRIKIQQSAIFVKEKLTINMLLIKNIIKLGTIVIIQGNIEYQQISISISICNLKYGLPKEIPIVFRNVCNYDYHSIIKELAEKFEKQFTCLEEKTEKYITYTVPIEKEITRIYKNGEKITKK